MRRRDRERYDRRVGAWLVRTYNTTIDVGNPDGPSRPVKVAAVSFVDRQGVWFDSERLSTFLRSWDQVRADMRPARG